MKRSPLKRKTRLRPWRPTKRRSERVVDDSYRAKVRGLPCICPEFTPWTSVSRSIESGCYGTTHAHHMRELAEAGMGQKPSDDLCVPFCETHHDNWHTHSGVFKDKSREWRVAFALAAVQETRARLNWEEPSDE